MFFEIVLAQSSRVPFLQSTIDPFEGTRNGRTNDDEQRRNHPFGSDARNQGKTSDTEVSSFDTEFDFTAGQ
jgi:hypothetical protein